MARSTRRAGPALTRGPLLVFGPRSTTLRLRPVAPPHAPAVRAGHRSPPRDRRRAGPGARAGSRRGAAARPHRALHRDRAALLRGSRGLARGGHRPRRHAGVRGHARGVGGCRRRIAPGDGGHPARRRGARLPPGRRAPPRDGRARLGLLRLRRRRRSRSRSPGARARGCSTWTSTSTTATASRRSTATIPGC